MKKYYGNEVENLLNQYLQFLFQANSRIDNCAYSLDTELLLPNTSAIIHTNVAHKYPQLSDGVSDMMIRSNMRPKRLKLDEDTKIYSNAYEVFAEIVRTEEENRRKLIELLDQFEYDIENKQICLALEDMLVKCVADLRQYNIWADKIKIYVDNGKQYKIDKDIGNITGL